MRLEYKSLPLSEVKVLDESDTSMTVEGYVSTVDLDRGQDKICSKAFEDSIKQKFTNCVAAGKRPKVKFLYQHDTKQIIGWPTEMKADDKGLYCKFEFINDEDFPEARKAWKLCKWDLLDSFSIGYVAKDYDFIDDEETGKSFRYLKEVDLYECSLVTIPMNEKAEVVKVKDIGEEQVEKELKTLSEEVRSLREAVEAMGQLVTQLTPKEPEASESAQETPASEEPQAAETPESKEDDMEEEEGEDQGSHCAGCTCEKAQDKLEEKSLENLEEEKGLLLLLSNLVTHISEKENKLND